MCQAVCSAFDLFCFFHLILTIIPGGRYITVYMSFMKIGEVESPPQAHKGAAKIQTQALRCQLSPAFLFVLPKSLTKLCLNVLLWVVSALPWSVPEKEGWR